MKSDKNKILFQKNYSFFDQIKKKLTPNFDDVSKLVPQIQKLGKNHTLNDLSIKSQKGGALETNDEIEYILSKYHTSLSPDAISDLRISIKQMLELQHYKNLQTRHNESSQPSLIENLQFIDDTLRTGQITSSDDIIPENEERMKEMTNRIIRELWFKLEKENIPINVDPIEYIKKKYQQKNGKKMSYLFSGVLTVVGFVLLLTLISELFFPFLLKALENGKNHSFFSIIINFAESSSQQIFTKLTEFLPKLGVFFDKKVVPFFLKLVEIVVIRIMIKLPLKIIYFISLKSKPLLETIFAKIIRPSGKILWNELFLLLIFTTKSVQNISKMTIKYIFDVVQEFITFVYLYSSFPRINILNKKKEDSKNNNSKNTTNKTNTTNTKNTTKRNANVINAKSLKNDILEDKKKEEKRNELEIQKRKKFELIEKKSNNQNHDGKT